MPDWGRRVDGAEATLYAPFEADGPPVALPDALAIAAEPDGRPAFRLSAVRALGPDGGGGHGQLSFELMLEAGADGAAARPVPALRGWLRLRSEMVGIPPELRGPIGLDCSGLGLARLAVPLAAEGVGFVEAALDGGAFPVMAVAEIEVAGVAPRLAATATIDVGRLQAVLGAGATTPADLLDRLATDPGGAGVSVTGAVDLPSPAAVAAVVADHLRATLCAGPLRPLAEEGLALVLSDGAMHEGTVSLDLDRALVATRAITLQLDPFEAARSLAAARGAGDPLVVRTTSLPLPTGRHRVTIDAGLRRPLAGPLGLGATMVVPPRPPTRPHEVRRDFDLPDDGSGVAQEVQLAPGEPLEWSLGGFAFWPRADGRGVLRLPGPVVPVVGPQAILAPAAFPLRFLDVEAEPALLGIAAVTVVAEGAWDGGTARATASLTDAAPRVTLALPDGAGPVRMRAELVPVRGGGRIVVEPGEAGDWQVSLAEVPGHGPRGVVIHVALPDGVPVAAVEVLPEEATPDAEPEVLSFTPGTPQRVYRWLCRDPFRAGLRWRWRGDREFTILPREVERLDLVRGGNDMDGDLPGRQFGALRAWPEPAASGARDGWRYLPAAPRPQLTPAGTPQVTAIEAGPMLMLTVGASLGASEAELEAARGAIAAEAGGEARAVDLRPADLAPRGATLVLAPSGAAERPLGQAAPSPVPPHPAAFSAMLQGEDATAAAAALKGGAGRLLVRYEVDLAASRAASARIEGEWEDGRDLDALLAAGDLALVVEADEGASAALVERVRAEVTEAARAALSALFSPGGGPTTDAGTAGRSGLLARVRRTEPAHRSLRLEADVGDWI